MHKANQQNKVCAKCKVSKNLIDFGRDASRIDGRYSYCKQCRRKPNLKELETLELSAKGLKICTLCQKTKPFVAFEKDSSKSLGHTSRCKKCKSEERKKKAHVWHAKKSEMIRLNAQGQSLCYKCREVKDFRSFLRSKTTGSGVFNLCLDCNNKTKREYSRKRSKAKRDYTRWEVFEDDNFTCYICEDVLNPDVFCPDPKSLTIDHVVPIAREGLDERDNVRTACMDCNRKKNDMYLDDFLLKRAIEQ